MQTFRGACIVLALGIIAAGVTTRVQAPWDIAAAALASLMGATSLLVFAVRFTVARRSSCTRSG